MSDHPPERWILALDVKDDAAPSAVTMRRLLKHLWRRWGIKCKGFSEDRRIYELTCENEKLRKIIDGLAARVAAQSEVLACQAERREGP